MTSIIVKPLIDQVAQLEQEIASLKAQGHQQAPNENGKEEQ